jgi:FkbM family methyltransferase
MKNNMPVNDPLFNLLELEGVPTILDIGANPLDGGDPPYNTMLKSRLCRLIGFEPQEEALQALLTKKSDLESYYPYALGDGSTKSLYICTASGMTSTLKPDEKNLNLFNEFSFLGSVKETIEIETTRLDDVVEIDKIDFLKIDVQGAELDIFKSGAKYLKNAVAIQTEVSFISLYEKQPTFGEVDVYLRSMGFLPHAMTALKRWPLSPMAINGDTRHPLNQLLEADIVYVRDFTEPSKMTCEQWKMLALIAHHCYNSFDLALRCINICEQEGYLSDGAVTGYLEIVNTKLSQTT